MTAASIATGVATAGRRPAGSVGPRPTVALYPVAVYARSIVYSPVWGSGVEKSTTPAPSPEKEAFVGAPEVPPRAQNACVQPAQASVMLSEASVRRTPGAAPPHA